ncbi:MAG: hypothetical protein C0448_01245 [Sphingobacteriaceae bacterium]|nr:hypothetical protein [Sphingobacteriaceae bacterium]
MSRRILYIFIIVLITRFSCYATHIVGGSLTYVYNGGSNYTITLKLYRDCGAGTAALPGSVLISVLGNNGAPFSPSKDISIPLGTVTNVPSNLSPCAIPPNPLPCVQEAVYTKTVNNLPSNFGGYHLYYQIVARNLTLTNVNAACSCIGESFYAHIPGTNETNIWNENFSLANGTTIDNGTTAWATTSGSVAPNSAMVNNNLFEIKGANNAKYTWTSQNINISSCTSVGVTVNLKESGTLDANDSILVYYRLNGGAMTLFPTNGFKADDFTSALASVTGLVGTNLEIIIRTRFDGNSPNSEIYKIDDIDVNCFSGPFISNSNPVFNLFPPLFICVNQPFSFNHAATDVDGDSLVYSLYTPFDGDNAAGPLDPTFPANTASFTPITFLPGFSTTSPLGSPLSLNSSTGLLTGTPTIQGQFVVGVMVKEYRNGVYIGQTLRDFQFNVLNCPQPPPAITLNNVSVNDGCSKPLIASGITAASATWNSISPGAPGAYNNYLSCTSGCLTPTVSAIGTPPPFVDYLVCGNSISCAGTFVCDTLRVTFNSTLGVNIQPSNPTLCFGQTSTTLTALGSGGTPPYSYLWNNVNASQNIFVGVGTYNVKVTDGSGCPPAFNTIIVTSYSVPINANPGPDKTICKQNPLATINATVTGAVGGIWSGGLGSFSPNNTTLTNLNYTPSAAELAAGSATLFLTTTGNGNCPLDIDTLVIQYSNFTAASTTSVININCFGETNGSSSISLTGGTGPFSYSWSTVPTQTTNSVTNLSLGTYSITVVDGIGCTQVSTVVITQPPVMSIISTATNVSCNGGNNGALTTTVSGGTSPYTYLWLNTGQTSSGISNLGAGIYTLQVTDAKGCVTTHTTTVTEPTVLNVSLTGTNVSCFNGSTGSVSSTVSGGTSGYTYSWSPGGSTGSSITNVVSGAYTLIVTDSKGCVKSQTTTLTQPAALLAIPSVTNESCNYLNNGIASISASGGTSGYTYQWLPGLQTATSITNLSAGVYTVNVTDSQGCVTTTIATVTEPSTLSVNISNQINVSCFGGSNGSVSSSGLGGTPNYSYSWLPGGSTNAVLSGVQAGTYSLTVTDAKSCQTQTTVVITQPSVLNVSAGVTNVSCNGGNNGIISISPTGGNSPYLHTLFPGNIVSSNFASLSPGNYTVVTSDANNCLNTTTVNVSQPTTISSVVSYTNSNCGFQNGVASIAITSGGLPPFTYQWLPSGGTSSVTTNLFAGSYSVTVFDGNGCLTSNIVNINDIEGPVVSIASTTNVSCYGGSNGSAIATFSAGTGPFTYSWSPSGGNSLVANSLSIGTYVIKVTDNLGCIGLATTPLIIQPLPITTVLSHTNVSCFNGSNGIASVVASGGTPGYTYSWTPTGNISSSISGLTSGTYTVQVKDSYSCTSTNTIAVTQPTSSISLSVVSNSVSCFGGTNGSVIATANGGTLPYSYLWNGVGVSGNVLSNITAGTYTVTGTDFNGCAITNTVAVIEPPVISLLMSSVNSNCSNASGQASVSATGGAGSYTYQWSPNGVINSLNTNLLSGNYSVTVQDANGCSASNSISVLNNPAPTVNISGVSNVSCYGGSNGTATVNVVGGTGPFIYIWSPLGGNGNVGTNLSVGIYTVQVFSNNGCTVQATTPMITQPLPITTVLSHTNVSCFGGSNGMASIVANGGMPGYTYSWTPGGNTSTSISGLIQGTYTVQVKDSYSCTSTNTIVVSQPTLLSVNISSLTNVSCFGGNDGNATLNVLGGTSPFSYNWLPYGGNGSTVSGLINGTYTVNITDVNSCATSTIITIAQPSMALSATINSTGASCFGGTDGTATVNVIGGTTNYNYQWSPNGGNLSTATNLSAGNYLVTISDANNCQLTTPISVNQPSILTGTLITDDATCGLANGSIISQINGGTSPYSYSWNSGAYSTANVINIPANSYSLNVTDANNCMLTYSTIVNNLAGPTIGVVSTTSVLCNGDNNATATATISNAVLPYSFNWMPNGSNSLTATNLTAGTYTAQLIDAKGCTVTANAIINEPLPLSITSASVTNVLCFGQNNGSVNVSVSGGSSIYSYSWSPNVSSSAIASNLISGNYTVFVNDNNNCNTSLSLIVNEPSLLISTISNTTNPICYNTTGASTVAVSGGTMPYIYNWSTTPVQTGSSVGNLYAGNYTVSVIDANGCSVSNTLTIIEPTQIITSLSTSDTICIGQQANIMAGANGGAGNYYYTWQPSGIINSGTLSVSPTVNTTYTVVAFDQNGCAGIEDSINVIVYDLTSANVQVTGQTPICFGQVSIIEGQVNGNTGPVNISWNNGLGNTIGPFIEQPINSMTYIMTVTNACGLSVSDSVSITFNPPPVINIISDTIKGCAPSIINFSDSSITGNSLDPITSWSWDFGDGIISTSQNPSHVFNNAGTYTVNLTVTTDAGCTANSSSNPIIINAYSAPVANFSTNMIDFDIPYDVLHCTNLSNGGITYEWSFGDGSFSNDINPSYLYNSIGQHQIQLVVSNQYGCKDTAVAEIVTHSDVIFPNAFTPNPDGSSGGSYTISSLDNDVFFPYTSGVIDFKLQIYDRWGELIFESTDVKTGWDGYYRGKLCQMGVYVWKAYVKLNDSRIFKKTGDVTLLR